MKNRTWKLLINLRAWLPPKEDNRGGSKFSWKEENKIHFTWKKCFLYFNISRCLDVQIFFKYETAIFFLNLFFFCKFGIIRTTRWRTFLTTRLWHQWFLSRRKEQERRVWLTDWLTGWNHVRNHNLISLNHSYEINRWDYYIFLLH